MKKIISVSLSLLISSMLITSVVKAQTSDKGVSLAAIDGNPALVTNGKASSSDDKSASTKEGLKAAEKDIKASKANLKAMKANFRATENFKKIFKDAPAATWSVEEKVIVASFNRDAVKTDVVYDKSGRLIHSLSFFSADKTPENIRSIVENDYPNGDITSAVQVKENDLDFFIVNLEDKRTIKQVAVYDGATNLIKEFTKSR